MDKAKKVIKNGAPCVDIRKQPDSEWSFKSWIVGNQDLVI